MKALSCLRCFLILTGLSLAAACRVTGDADAQPEFTREPEYRVDLFEERSPADGTPAFGLWLERRELSACAGYGVDAAVGMQGNDIQVTILGVLPPPAPCSGDSAPARQFVPLGNLADGNYGFTLSLRDVVTNQGSLTVSQGHYVLSLPDAQGVIVQNFVLETMPAGIVWGYAATPDEMVQPVADNFIADLKTLTGDDGLAPGFYSYFTVSGTGDFIFHERSAPAGPANLFVRRLTASPDALKGLLQNYRDASQQPLQIKCWTTEGEL